MPNYQTISDNAVVLSRIDYGEKDRIITVLTKDHGKQKAIAKAVRSSKSKLAGGIELFAENKVVLKRSKTDLFILASARMDKYFGEIAKNIEATNYIYEMLRLINKYTPEAEGKEYYPLLINLLESAKAEKISLTLVKIWFELKLMQSQGFLPNLNSDKNGARLRENNNFEFDYDRHCFFAKSAGSFTQKHIKLLRQILVYKKPTGILGNLGYIDEQSHRLTNSLVKKHFAD